MALELSPEQLLGGQTDPAASTAAPSTGAPDTTGALPMDTTSTGGASSLGGLPPPPPKGGVSEDLRTQFARNADKLIKTASDPSAPGAWAKALVGGLQSALAGVGNIGKVPAGGGALYGVGKVMEARQAQQNEQKKQASQAKQQEFENDYKTKELKMKQDAQDADTLIRGVKTQDALRHSTSEAQDEMYNKIYKPWETAQKDAGQTVIQANMTDMELKQLAAQHKSDSDPQGMKWLSDQNLHQDGWRNVTDPNGDIIQGTDRNGKPTGAPQRQATYSALTWGDPLTINASIASQAKKYLGKDFKEGDVLQPRDAGALRAQIGLKVVEENAASQAALEGGTTKEKLAELQDKAEFREAGHTFLPWLNDAKGDPGLAMKNMQDAAKEIDSKTGQPTDHAQAVQKQLDSVKNGMGQKIIDKSIDQWEKSSLENIKANATAAKNKPLEVEGDPNLTGQPYLKSLPPSRQPVMQAFINGQLPPGQLQRMLSSKDGQQFLAEAALSDPQLDVSKIGGYVEATKKFTSGQVANQLNSAGTSLVHLKALYDDNKLPGALIGGVNYAKRQADLNDASMELARFLAGGNAPSNQDIEGAKNSLDPSVFRTLDPQGSKQAAVEEQNDRIMEKVSQYQNEWKDAMPSSRWNKPMPGVSPQQIEAAQYIRNKGQAAQATIEVPLPDGHSAHFNTQEQADQFKAALAAQSGVKQ